MADERRWKDKQKCKHLIGCLHGKAKKFVLNLDKKICRDYHLLKKALKKRYGKDDGDRVSSKRHQDYHTTSVTDTGPSTSVKSRSPSDPSTYSDSVSTHHTSDRNSQTRQQLSWSSAYQSHCVEVIHPSPTYSVSMSALDRYYELNGHDASVSSSKGDWNGVDWTGHSPKMGNKSADGSRNGDLPRTSSHIIARRVPSVEFNDCVGTRQMRKPEMIQTHPSRGQKFELEQSGSDVGVGASRRLTRSQVHHQPSKHASDAKVEKLAMLLGFLGLQWHHSRYQALEYAPFPDIYVEKPLHPVDLNVDTMRESAVSEDTLNVDTSDSVEANLVNHDPTDAIVESDITECLETVDEVESPDKSFAECSEVADTYVTDSAVLASQPLLYAIFDEVVTQTESVIELVEREEFHSVTPSIVESDTMNVAVMQPKPDIVNDCELISLVQPVKVKESSACCESMVQQWSSERLRWKELTEKLLQENAEFRAERQHWIDLFGAYMQHVKDERKNERTVFLSLLKDDDTAQKICTKDSDVAIPSLLTGSTEYIHSQDADTEHATDVMDSCVDMSTALFIHTPDTTIPSTNVFVNGMTSECNTDDATVNGEAFSDEKPHVDCSMACSQVSTGTEAVNHDHSGGITLMTECFGHKAGKKDEQSFNIDAGWTGKQQRSADMNEGDNTSACLTLPAETETTYENGSVIDPDVFTFDEKVLADASLRDRHKNPLCRSPSKTFVAFEKVKSSNNVSTSSLGKEAAQLSSWFPV